MDLGRRNRIKAEGGMSSMTDLVFLLLIFFIIMSLAHDAVPVDLPSAENIPPTSRNALVVIGISEENEYFFKEDTDKRYNFKELKPLLESKMENKIEKNIKISGDRTADYEYIFNLIALSKQKGWKPVLVYE